MEKFKKIAQIDVVDGSYKERMMKILDSTGFYIVDDPEYPTVFYLATKIEE